MITKFKLFENLSDDVVKMSNLNQEAYELEKSTKKKIKFILKDLILNDKKSMEMLSVGYDNVAETVKNCKIEEILDVIYQEEFDDIFVKISVRVKEKDDYKFLWNWKFSFNKKYVDEMMDSSRFGL